MNLECKEKKLEAYLKECKKVCIAYSSGVDSTFLLKKSIDTLGNKNVLAISATSSFFPQRETSETKEFCAKENVRHILIPVEEENIPGFNQNPRNRCYLCKKELFSNIIQTAKENGFEHVLEGSNMDDLGDYRPGLQAIKELNVKSPLRECELYKEEIRSLSRKYNLSTASKPSFACLASRFVYGETISKDKLKMVENSENFLMDLGFEQCRVRIHKELARIEVQEEDIQKIIDQRQIIDQKLKEFGFKFVSIDLTGYQTGKMNTFIKKEANE